MTKLDEDHSKNVIEQDDSGIGKHGQTHLPLLHRHGQDRDPGGPPQSGRSSIGFNFLQGIPLTGNGDSLVSDGEGGEGCKHYTHLAKFFKPTLQCSLCALSLKHSSSHAHAMFRTLLDPPLTSPCTEHSYLMFSVIPFILVFHFHSANWTFCLAGLSNSLCSQVMSPTLRLK